MSDLNLDLKQLRRQLPELIDCLEDGADSRLDTWCRALDVKLLSRLDPDFPLVAAVCGGGSSGKSTLVNSLAGRYISPVGGTAGINRRVLLVFHPRWLESKLFLPALEETLAVRTEALQNPQQLETPGNPLYATLESMPDNLVLLDTPDFDTGAQGVYANRPTARKWLETSDLLIYLFTNSNYANRDNTDFVRQVLNGIGNRPCFLVYRIYPGLEDSLVREHAGLVATNLYDRNAGKMVLGIFRADEDNAVAEGRKPLAIRPVDGGHDFHRRLTKVDAAAWRRQVSVSVLSDVVLQARQAADKAAARLAHLDLYLAALKSIQSRCVTQALTRFPTERVFKLFIRIWLQSDPAHVRLMRKTGSLVEWPLAKLSRAVRYLKEGRRRPGTADSGLKAQRQEVEIDLLKAADQLLRAAGADFLKIDLDYQPDLYQQAKALACQGPDIAAVGPARPIRPDDSENGFSSVSIELPACLVSARAAVRMVDRDILNKRLAAAKDLILQPSRQLEKDLEHLATKLRSQMGLFDQLRQTAAAMLNVLPATAAVTYIVSTGDPVGATAIKIKLGSLLGLKDLYALIAVPATSGLKKADRRQLQMVLEPVARRWIDSKLALVQNLFTEQISSPLITAAEQTLSRAGRLLKDVETILKRIQGKGKL